jgi:NAD(P)-dependent dehydrogenase (short-subunit alcohol dehydrogenase family)
MTLAFQNKIAIVTGAGRGLGAAIARDLAAAGVRVAVNDINPDRAERTAAAIRADGGEAIAIAADISNKFRCVSLIEEVRAEWDGVDILVNNAAVSGRSSILKLDEWDWQRTIDVNLKGTFFMSQLAGRVMADMMERGGAPSPDPPGGVIVNVASTAGSETALQDQAAYAASKAGVIGFTRECAREYAAYNVRVNAVAPAETPPPAPEALVALVRFLCSDDAAHLSGMILPVGGR